MIKKAIITKVENKKLCFVFEDGKLSELYHFEKSLLNNIYLCRVNNIIESIGGAFVYTDVGQGFLKLPSNNKFNIKNNDLVVAQVIKESYDSKEFTLSTTITIKGKYVIVKHGERGVAISSKINEESIVDRLKKIYFSNSFDDYFILFRTECKFADIEEIQLELSEIVDNLNKILNIAKYSNKPIKLFENSIDFDVIRDCEIVTDIKEIYYEIPKEFNAEIYEDDYPLVNIYGLNKEIKKLKNKRVHMKNGSNIVIEDTEALTVIDVNSSKAVSNGKEYVDAYEINEIAARECVRQIKLRNISGIILIDFLNMKKNIDNENIINVLKKELITDKAKSVIYGFTKLGLLEMSRSREYKNLKEYLEWK